MHCTSRGILGNLFSTVAQRSRNLPPSFLLPAFTKSQTSSFSSTAPANARKDGNPRRGMSAIRRTGLGKRFKLSVKLEDLPKPVLDPKLRSAVETDENHGLWGFFDKNKSPIMTPEELASHGRAWTLGELRKKDFQDLWKLWWLCVKEVNRVKTSERERARLEAGYGEFEATQRLIEIRRTQRAIKHTLTTRWYQFENARILAMEDPEVNLYADTTTGESGYRPRDPASGS